MSEPTPLEAIFFAALEKAPDQRAAYLNEACSGDQDLRRRVERMLAAQADSASFLEAPPSAVVAIGSPTMDQAPLEMPGTQIGPYKLLQQIGEGGMGVVYMAEQTEPVQRKVALKLIKPGMDSRQVIARFEAERQALALMDHPNIAKVLDASATDSGRPYFVMELVKGVPITKYCDEHRLTLKERLQLFVPVCQAIQHAHQKGIIHRDIKPTNILVSLYDGQPVPKVIDFGVAKATAQKLTEKTMFTGFGQLVGTLEYMSPEQAQFNQLDIDTRSDVYSLGVLLYELLSGSTPFEQAQLRTVAFDETLRIIREEEPPKPSARLSTSETLPLIAANRNIAPARLSKLVRGELDWIVMKCLEKDRSGRYETANGLATDLQHYLADEPVLACPPSVVYRLRKFMNRHKGSVATGLGLTVVAICLLMTGVIGVVERDRQQRRMEQSSRQDLAAAEAFLQSHDYAAAVSRLKIAAEHLPANLGNDHALAVDVERVTEEASARLAAQRRYQDFQLRRASLYVSVQTVAQGWQSRCQDALRLYHVLDDDHWKERAEFTYLDQAAQRELDDNIAEVLFLLASRLREEIFTPVDVEPLLRRSIEVLRRLEEIHGPIKAAYLTNAKSWAAIGEPSLAKQAIEKAESLKLDSALDYFVMGEFHRYAGQYDLAIDMYYRALLLKPDHYLCLIGLGGSLLATNRLEAAEAVCTGAIGLNQVGPHAHSVRGQARKFQGKLDLAFGDFRKAAELNPHDALSYAFQGEILHHQGHSAKALEMFDRALAVSEGSFTSRLTRAHTYQDIGKFEKAVADYTRAIEQLEWKAGIDAKRRYPDGVSSTLINAYFNRALCNLQIGDSENAKPDIEKLLAIAPNRPEARLCHSYCLLQQGKYREAIAGAEQVLALPPEKIAQGDYYNLACVYSVASARAAKDEQNSEREMLQTQFAKQAVEMLRQAIETGANDFNHIRKDTDLDPIRNLPAFKELLEKHASPVKDTAQAETPSDK